MRLFFRLVAFFEATSYVLLMGDVVFYRAFDGPDFTAAIGPVHGLLFVAYLALVAPARAACGWSGREIVWVLLASVIPFGGYVVDRKLLREERAPVPAAA